jgi:hypothetical protein
LSTPHIICFGPGPKFKGGIAQYNTALARSLKDEGAQVTIVSWTQQYPAIIPREFVDKTSRSDFLEGYDIPVQYLTNWNDPRTWKQHREGHRRAEAGQGDHPVVQPHAGHSAEHHREVPAPSTRKPRSSSTCTS